MKQTFPCNSICVGSIKDDQPSNKITKQRSLSTKLYKNEEQNEENDDDDDNDEKNCPCRYSRSAKVHIIK